jgi:prevent-host-death family protein
MFDNDPNRKGNVAELAIAKEAAKLGLSVLKPMTEHEAYDLAFDLGRRILRVQCKWARRTGDVVVVNLSRNRRGPGGFNRANYTAAEIDAVAAYCDDLDRCFFIPIEAVDGRWSFQLRLSPPRNGQRAALNWAEKFSLGAVAQLAERSNGIREAEGSNPSSSTPPDEAEPGVESVGAHEFRNHFGLYMERAAGGTEVLISRRGRPYARLCPPERTTSV